MQKIYHGFSLIELMIVVAIIGTLAVIAVPSYQRYAQRARFAEVIAATDPFKTSVSLALQQGISMADINLGSADLPPAPSPTKNLADLTVSMGTITATATTLAGNSTFILTPNTDGSQWAVSGTCLTVGLCSA